MQVQVSGRRLEIGEALRARVADEISTSIGKYFERGGDAEVVVSRDRYGFQIDCQVTLASGQQLQSHGAGSDPRTALDEAVGRIETRIRRYKRRLKSHTPAANAKAAETAALYVLRLPEDEAEEEIWRAGDGHSPPAAMVIAETESALRTMTVSMAVMEMDLSGAQTIVFRNAAHGGLSVIYRRPDGNVGWIDPERTKIR
ncbi:MAG TPA: ribosome-associated translation inhibitor RaiA [Caulobacteraceae bacterium]|nr:ribosome-associated translation inhibitor RaiA [Caulobacteraceae bacterium]